MVKIAVLITSHNRKNKTTKCLKSLFDSINIFNYETSFDIYLVDDGSTDGTTQEINKNFPTVNIIQGLGHLYWSGGMRLAWTASLDKDINYDYFLLLNDDTYLFKDALKEILNQSIFFYTKNLTHAIFIGNTNDIKTGTISYGGRKLYSRNRPNGYLVQSDTQCIECDLGEANIMLVPEIIVRKIGILSKKFTHGLADYDYTLRAKKNGVKVIVAPGILGTCVNDHKKTWKSANTSLEERIEYLYHPKGLAYKEYLFYIKRHFPYHFPEAIFKLWLKTLLPIVYDKLK